MSRSILSVLVFTLSLACFGAEASDYSGTYVSADPGGTVALRSNEPGDTEETVAAREVYINRVKLDSAFVLAAETQYQTTLQDGRYWYDAACGAWGVEGGPTAGFLIAGLGLPGPMPEDISGGGTGIFINGREIHVLDREALQKIFGQTIPGRYWLDAQGNLGPVGGPAIANLAMAIQKARESVTHGYGNAGGARGTVGGGMYSGRTATGKSVFWYPGM